MALSRRNLLAATAMGVAGIALRSTVLADRAWAAPVAPPLAGIREFPSDYTTRNVVIGLEQQTGTGRGWMKPITALAEGSLKRSLGSGLPANPSTARSLLAFAQMTDMHIIDDQSPLRVEFMDRYSDIGSGFSGYDFVSAYRPHEALSTHVIDAMCRTIAELGSGPMTGLPLSMTIVTGDSADNCQLNETRWYVDLLDGGRTITPNSGATFDESVTGDLVGNDERYWHPQRFGSETSKYTVAGFPKIDGFLGAARRPYQSHGLGMPWYAAFGNHDTEVQGNIQSDGEVEIAGIDFSGPVNWRDRAVGTTKPTNDVFGLPNISPGGKPMEIEAALDNMVLVGTEVTADQNRRLLSKYEYIREHFDTAGTPVGHGFVDSVSSAGWAQNLPYYSFPVGDLFHFICLDTTSAQGAGGSLDQAQYDWLAAELQTNSTKWELPGGGLASAPFHRDKLIVVFAHHTLTSIDNTDSARPVNGDQVRALLLRFPNVIMMVDGHTHNNNIWAHERPASSHFSGGFWEVNTASHIDWPIQSRIIEVAEGDGVLSIFTTMLDLNVPLNYNGDLSTTSSLASLARELASNDLQEVRGDKGFGRRGTAGDRNTQLLLPAPSPFPVQAVPVHGAPVAMTQTVNNQSGIGIQAFGVSEDGTLYQAGLALSGNPPQWQAAPGAPKLKSVAAATDLNGTTEVFGIDTFGTIHHSSFGGEFGAWAPWTTFDGVFTSIAAARNANGKLQVFATGITGEIATRYQNFAGGDSWTGWQQMQGTLDSIAAVTDADGKINLFGVDRFGNVYQKQQLVANATDPSGSWSSWLNLPLPPVTSRAVAASLDDFGNLQVFASGGQAVYQIQKRPDAWNFNWQVIPPGSNITGVAAAKNAGSNSTVLLGVSPNGTAFTDVADGGPIGGFMGWGAIPGATLRTFT